MAVFDILFSILTILTLTKMTAFQPVPKKIRGGTKKVGETFENRNERFVPLHCE